jgi:glutathione S-transferase
MAEIILHHYPRSPFSEKVRLVFGLKGINWRSVEIPVFPPKPDLMPLTGGYRKTPVMQIGADIFCDTRIILREIDRLFPKPKLHGAAGSAMIAAWADSTLFVNAVGLVMGTYADRIPPALKEDRNTFTAGLFDADRFKGEQPAQRAAFRAHMAWVEESLGDQRAFLTGPSPDIADFALYHPLWFVRQNFKEPDFLADRPATQAWYARMEAHGHGAPSAMDAGEALAVAKDTQPTPVDTGSAGDLSGCRAGDVVVVSANDYGRDPVAGELLAIDDTRIVLRRGDIKVGTVHLHFPRVGFDVMRQ